MPSWCPARSTLRKRARLCLVGFFAALVLGGSDAQANGGAKYDFRFFPTIGTPTTTFRVVFTAPHRSNGDDTWYEVDGVGPRGCPSIYEVTNRRIRRGDRVVMRLTPLNDLYLNTRETWCLGSYVGYVYFEGYAISGQLGALRSPG